MAKRRRARTRVRAKSRTGKKQGWNIFLLIPVLVLVVFVAVNKPQTASVLGASTVAFRSATISWAPVPNSVSYNIYYKGQSDSKYIHAVPGIPASTTMYTINYLKKSSNYQYYVAAVNGSGAEFWFSPQKWMFPTR